MSYELRLYQSRLGMTPLDVARADQKAKLIPHAERGAEGATRRAAERLAETHPNLKLLRHDWRKLGLWLEEESRRWVPQHTLQNEAGIEIRLLVDRGFVEIPYWHQGPKAEAVFADAQQYLQIIQQQTGWFAYDPQLDELLDLAKQLNGSLACYQESSRKIPKASPAGKPKAKKPSWIWGHRRKS